MKTCAGCGASAQLHPYVVVQAADGGGFESKPVCTPCWKDPAHRTTPLKGHFFQVHQAEAAVAAAGSSSLGG